jgi:uncharacterized membrane protein YhaH (DUF805 family)
MMASTRRRVLFAAGASIVSFWAYDTVFRHERYGSLHGVTLSKLFLETTLVMLVMLLMMTTTTSMTTRRNHDSERPCALLQ